MILRLFRIGIMSAVVVSLSACSKPDASVCGSLPVRLPHAAVSADDHRQNVYYCVERWAARLARSKASNDTDVVKAVMGGCEDAIIRMRDQMKAEDEAGRIEMVPGFWQRRALFIVIQTRAGGCYPDA